MSKPCKPALKTAAASQANHITPVDRHLSGDDASMSSNNTGPVISETTTTTATSSINLLLRRHVLDWPVRQLVGRSTAGFEIGRSLA